MKKNVFFLTCLYLLGLPGLFAAKVDTLDIVSEVMRKKIKAAVVLPEGYNKSKEAFPVLYLLHGGRGEYKDWLTKVPDKALVGKLADQYKIIIVTPDAGVTSYYIDSPVNPESQYETFISKELIDHVDKAYRTIARRDGRIITGLSMGGHGAMYLAIRHPDTFCAVGSMSGALDLNTDKWKLPEDYLQDINKRLGGILGDKKEVLGRYRENSVVNMVEKLIGTDLKIIFDCGVDDFLIVPNRELHQRLIYLNIPHEYTERPGAHTWDYWGNALPNHMLFFYGVWKSKGILK